MTETGFGKGGYAYTEAETPSAPILEENTSITILVTIGDDSNPAYTEYAIYNETDEAYIDVSGYGSASEVWQSRGAWGTVTARELSPSSEYTFRVKARNRDGIETPLGPGSTITPFGLNYDEILLPFEVRKASSTISSPDFMAGLQASIRLAGKDLNDFGFHVDTISGLDMPEIVSDEELVPGDHTWHVWDEYFSPKRIVMDGYMHGSSTNDLRLRLAYLKSFLATFEGNPWRSTAPVWLERNDIPDRHWIAYYNSIDAVETLGRRDISSSARIRVTLKCPVPYAISNNVIRNVFTPDAGTFIPVDLGNAPSDGIYVIKGSAENPSFTVGDMVFLCDFSEGLSFTDVENASGDGVYCPSENEAGAYRTTETGTGISITGSDTIRYTAIGNNANGSWIVVIAPMWQSSSQSTDVVVLEHRYDSDNYIRLYWSVSGNCWVFRKRAYGIDYEVMSEPHAFVSGTRIILGITYDSTNAGGMKIFVDGIQSGVGGNTSVLSFPPETLTLHEGSGAMQPDAVFDFIAGWSRMLSADEMLKIATDPAAVVNRNTTVSYTGTLAENDLLTLDSQQKTAELFDVSEGTRTNVVGSLNGTIPALTPGRRRTASDRTQTMVYSKTAAGQMEVRYRRRYL
ncbi:MAG: hypothetical protein JXB48_11940 [Candidatus Latescibacteria bacterium]|nr:hypothetical protein [Candidatus Latescibacterota bacterium]